MVSGRPTTRWIRQHCSHTWSAWPWGPPPGSFPRRITSHSRCHLLSTVAPEPAALPASLHPRVAATACSLREQGYAVLDNVLGETWCHLLRDDIITLAERQALGRNATHLVQPDGTLQLLAKRAIFETELRDPSLRAACPWLSQLATDNLLSAGLTDALQGRQLPRWTIKIQLNSGGGACFPFHFDSDRALDSRVVTAILYLNPDWQPAHGGQLLLLPFPLAPVQVDPVFDRLCASRSIASTCSIVVRRHCPYVLPS